MTAIEQRDGRYKVDDRMTLSREELERLCRVTESMVVLNLYGGKLDWKPEWHVTLNINKP